MVVCHFVDNSSFNIFIFYFAYLQNIMIRLGELAVSLVSSQGEREKGEVFSLNNFSYFYMREEHM